MPSPVPPLSPPRPFRLLVDLSQMLPGGANGGVKPFILEYLGWIGRQRRVPVEIIYLTSSRSHAEVRALARARDELVCVQDDNTGERPAGHEVAPRERTWLNPPVDLARRLRADVLYCPLSWTEFRCPGVPLVATIVDVLHRDFPFTLGPGDIAWRETLFADLLRFSDRFQCISDYTTGQMQQHFGVPRERMFLTHIAIHGRFRALPSGIGEDAGAEPSEAGPYFFYPANAWVHKNHEALLLAFYAYRQNARREGVDRPWRLVLTGHEDERMAGLRALADTLGLSADDAVRFAGHVSPRRLETLWRGAGALVFPSLHEGFGIPLVEAMEHGVPVLCSAAGSLPEVGGDACEYVDTRCPAEFATAMGRLAGDADRRRELAARGRERLRGFTLEREASAFLDELLAAAARPARPTVRGVWPDGWTGPAAVFGPANLPAGARVRLCLTLQAMPAPRRVRLFSGERFLGGWDLDPGRAHRVEVVFRPADHETIRLEVPDAHPLSDTDHRQHGVWVDAFTVSPADAADGENGPTGVNLLQPDTGIGTEPGVDAAVTRGEPLAA